MDTSRISWRLGITIQTLLEVRWETQCPFLVAKVILGFLSIFNKNQGSATFEALSSPCLLRCQTDVRPPFQMRWGPRAFSRVSTGYSDIPSFLEVKEGPVFMPLWGNQAFFQVRASRCPFHLRQQTQGPSHISIAEGSLLLRSFSKVDIPLQSKPGNQLSSREVLGCTELSLSCCAETDVRLDLTWVSQTESLELPKEVKTLVMYDVERRMALETKQGNWASCRVDLG